MRILSFGIIISTLLFLSGIITDPIKDIVASDLPYLVNFYKYRHQHPEVSLEEQQTAADLAKELRDLGFDVFEGVGGYGLVAIAQNGDGPLLMYRTDMDGLPLYEKTGLDYASTVQVEYDGILTGAMHACGHDMHMTTWIGTARAMMKLRDRWSGTLMLIAQPAEEVGKGARMMLDAGLYERFGVPHAGIGLHCSPSIPAGQVGFCKGYALASAELVDIHVYGIGAHGAYPHKSVDPIVLSSMIVLELQTIVSRSVSPLESAVVTVGAIQGGTKHNIIPDEVVLKLTLRSYQDEVKDKIHQRIREITHGAALAAGLPEDKMPVIDWGDSFTPSTYNDPELVDKLAASAEEIIGSENVIEEKPVTGAEDFAFYGRTDDDVPTIMFWLGTVPDDRVQSGDIPSLHSPYYYPDPEKSIMTGVSVMTRALIDLFNAG